MTPENTGNIIDVPATPQDERRVRKGDGGTYLIVADDSHEFNVAMQYACRAAARNRGHLGILHIVQNDDFQQWNMVEARMKKELREQAERYIWNVAKTAQEHCGSLPVLYIGEGEKTEEILKILDEDETIIQLILGGNVTGTSPGPLISFFLNKGMARLKVPLVVIPAHHKEKN